MIMDQFNNLPPRQWIYVSKLIADRNIAARISNNAKDIRDYQRWSRVAKQLDHDIAYVMSGEWRP